MKKWQSEEQSKMIFIKYNNLNYNFKFETKPNQCMIWYKLSDPLNHCGLCIKRMENKETKWKASWYLKKNILIPAKTSTIDIDDLSDEKLISSFLRIIREDVNAYLNKMNISMLNTKSEQVELNKGQNEEELPHISLEDINNFLK